MAATNPIAIIGAGLSGLSLALAFHDQHIPSVLYETQAAPLDIGGAIMLSPNALRILDRIGVLELLEPRGYKFEQSYFRSQDDTVVGEFEFGSAEKYGYSGFRVYRHELINVLLDLIKQRGIRIEYGKKFDHVISETDEGVAWQFTDGSEGKAPLLVGADGIHSRVREYLHPGLRSKFTNMIGITAAVPREQLQVGEDYLLPSTIMNPKLGAFVIAPQQADGSEVLIGRQYRFTDPEPDREGWRKMAANKQWAIDFLRLGHEDFPPIVEHATSAISTDKINMWPFYVIPKLDTWSSEKHAGVIILGDAAHAIPPTAGQGVNQAFEDIYVLAGMLGKSGWKPQTSEADKLKSALKKWQSVRQARVDHVLQLNEQINERRLPSNKSVEFKPFDLDWLYAADFDKMIADCI